MNVNIGCVIMASGLARRFGSNKLLHDFHGQPMIHRILDSTAKVPLTCRVVVTRHPEIAEICREKQVPFVLHDLPLRSDTVRLGIKYLLDRYPDLEGIMFAASDQPCLKSESIRNLYDSFAGGPDYIYRLSSSGTEGNPVLFPRSTFDALLNLPEGKGGGAVIKRHPELLRLVEAFDARELIDVDTPEILRQLLQTEEV